MRLLVALITALAALLGLAGTAEAELASSCSCTPSPTFTVAPEGKPKGTILLIHGGAWVWGSSELLRARAVEYAAQGWRAVSIGYPLRDLPAAYYTVKQEALRYGRRAYAVGFSAGGTMATWLAARGMVRAAVNFGGPVDLRRSFGDQRELWKTDDLARWSPTRAMRQRHDRKLKMRSIAGADDPFLNSGQRALLLRHAGVRTHVLPGVGHETQSWQWAYASRYFDRLLAR